VPTVGSLLRTLLGRSRRWGRRDLRDLAARGQRRALVGGALGLVPGTGIDERDQRSERIDQRWPVSLLML